MNKTELIEKMAEVSGLPKTQTEKVLRAFEDVVTDTLYEGGKVQLTGFGTFEVVERKARIGRNPSTGEEMQIPAGKAPKFKPGKALKDAIKNE